jgi:3-oxoacyl-[acyl-carrier protein] reductase
VETGLKDTRILVTGGSGGIGSAIARLVAGEGAQVCVHYNRGKARAEQVADEIISAGGRAFTCGADLTSEQDVDALYACCAVSMGGVDHVVANAGMRYDDAKPIQEMPLDQWRATIDGDLTSVFLTCRAFFRHLAQEKRESASVVLIGSTAGIFGEAGYADYASAKAGMTYGLLKSLKNEIVHLAARGRVNCVCPGWTRTEMGRAATTDPALLARVCATIPMNKIATAEDVAGVVVWLLSEELSGHVSGQVVEVAGGMEGRLLNTP